MGMYSQHLLAEPNQALFTIEERRAAFEWLQRYRGTPMASILMHELARLEHLAESTSEYAEFYRWIRSTGGMMTRPGVLSLDLIAEWREDVMAQDEELDDAIRLAIKYEQRRDRIKRQRMHLVGDAIMILEKAGVPAEYLEGAKAVLTQERERNDITV